MGGSCYIDLLSMRNKAHSTEASTHFYSVCRPSWVFKFCLPGWLAGMVEGKVSHQAEPKVRKQRDTLYFSGIE